MNTSCRLYRTSHSRIGLNMKRRFCLALAAGLMALATACGSNGHTPASASTSSASATKAAQPPKTDQKPSSAPRATASPAQSTYALPSGRIRLQGLSVPAMPGWTKSSLWSVQAQQFSAMSGCTGVPANCPFFVALPASMSTKNVLMGFLACNVIDPGTYKMPESAGTVDVDGVTATFYKVQSGKCNQSKMPTGNMGYAWLISGKFLLVGSDGMSTSVHLNVNEMDWALAHAKWVK